MYRPFFERHFEPDKTVVRDLMELTSYFTKHRCRQWGIHFESLDHLKDRQGQQAIKFWISFHGVKVSEGVTSGKASHRLEKGLEKVKEVKESEEWNDTGLLNEVLQQVLPKQFTNRITASLSREEKEPEGDVEAGQKEARRRLSIADELDGVCDCAQREGEEEERQEEHEHEEGRRKSAWWD